MKLQFQPENSLGLNVLDLGYFNSIQSLQHQKVPMTVDNLIAVVEESFNEEDADTLDNVFLYLQREMEDTMRCGGGKNYKVSHMGKKKLRKEGKLPETL